MHSNFVKRLLKAAWVLELVVAVLILAVTLLELFLLGEGTLSQVLGGSFSADAFFADAMTIVVGIEFVKMLMLHTPRAVTDVLLFAIAAIIRVMKGQDARLPLLSKFSDWAFGFANQDQN